MRLLLRWAGRLLLAICALAVAEFIGLAFAFSVGILFTPFVPFLVSGGAIAGCAALIVGSVRARRGACAGGIGGFDLLVHSLLLANAVLLAALFLLHRRPNIPPPDPSLVGLFATVSFALVGIPLSVGLSWMRAFTAPEGESVRLHRWVLRVSHGANLALGAAVLGPWAGGDVGRLIGSWLT